MKYLWHDFIASIREKPVKCYVWSIVFDGAETWTLQKVGQIPVKF